MHSFARAAVLGLALTVSARAASAQEPNAPPGSAAAPVPPAPIWRDSARYGGGPSVGAPRSDFMGKAPPSQWCLMNDAPGRADLSAGRSWREVSESWLGQVLSDTTEWGQGWRKVLGGAPTIAEDDSTAIQQVTEEPVCRAVAEILNRDLLGWKVGPPPVVVFRVRDFLVAHPSNAWRGEFGYAVGMSPELRIRGVAVW